MTYSVPDICDDFQDRIRILEPLFSNFGGTLCFSGEVVTIKCFEDNSLVRDLVKSPGNGRVIVVDGGGSLRHALLGDMLAANAVDNGWAGLVINGCVRDVEILGTLALGIRALNCYPLKTEKRGEGQNNIPVSFAGARIVPGQFLYADANGIIVADEDLELPFVQDA